MLSGHVPRSAPAPRRQHLLLEIWRTRDCLQQLLGWSLCWACTAPYYKGVGSFVHDVRAVDVRWTSVLA